MKKFSGIKILALLLVAFLFQGSIFAQAKSGGFSIKGGLWGIAGSFKSDLQDKHFVDNVLGGHGDDWGFGMIDLDWNEQKKYYLLNPIGVQYETGKMGPGSLVFALDSYGFYFLQGVMGFNPKYDFLSVSRGTIGTTDVNYKFRSTDFSIGYKLNFDKVFLTPKFLIRNFAQDYKENGLYFGSGYVGMVDGKLSSSAWTSFIGLDFLFAINQASAIFFDFAMGSPILGQITSSGKHSQTAFGGGDGYGIVGLHSGKVVHEVKGTRLQFGYQHTFGSSLALRVGYHLENLDSNYSNYGGIPLWAGGNRNGNGGAGIDIWELVTDKFVYKGTDKIEIKTLYLSLQYGF